ncbi:MULTISPECIES: class I adenylate-forming enzyme family protein [Heyndrickxia]|uniref:class I adenylate-forming enzyme family protein n=1 Tax=Heyndrickxia TaxID=2837504 RepID=UPI002DB8C7FF|nr:long-chain-fatty-acid--CoA ligase [Weizmannia sp. CD-2023]MEC2224633.1 long-chain-fatty-acid--CoA ligase [Weizmannia sp. CD-2023]MEC2304691.1 long-chain-fatty-acid--CoA ligase [Weizmannia sp. CD-2023]MEC2340972.1 long-chain-fatty-acid--CoA ligase [Weizmannia sp. CD-2023]
MHVGWMIKNIAEDPDPAVSGKTAVQEETGRAWTFKELHAISNAYANKLTQLGVRKGDRVGILLYNCLEYFGLYFAAAKIGAIAVRLNFRLSSPELVYCLNDSGTKILCFHAGLAGRIEPIQHEVPVEQFICLQEEASAVPGWAQPFSVLGEGQQEEPGVPSIHLNDPVMLMYTSGTTGRPKGAIWTHNTTFWFSAIQALKWGFQARETAMTTGPLYHVGAMEDIALPVLMRGGTVIITKSKNFEIQRVLSVIEKEKVACCFLFPFMIYDMLHLPDLAQYRLETLKTIYTGGDPLMPWALESIRAHFPHIGVVQVYGLTEGQPIAASLDPQDAAKKGSTVGKPMPLTAIQIADDAGNPLPAGEVGEILIKSPAVSEGYWKKPEATMETFADGWCKTGDLGFFDSEGFLTIAGRKKDMIRSGGENIYPAEIEDVLYRHEAVKEVSVIGIPDPKYMEAVCAIIVKKDGARLTEKEVTEYCKRHLASYKKPRKVIFVKEIPRTPSGKVQKFKLREQFGAG